MRSEPLQTRLSQAGGGQRGYVKSIERGKVGLVLLVFHKTLYGNGGGFLLFQAPGCIGDAFYSVQNTPLSVSIVRPPGMQVYATNPTASPETITLASSLSIDLDSSGSLVETCSAASGIRDVVPALFVVDLAATFTPPFSVR